MNTMQKTRQLYNEDAYQIECQATILDCIKEETGYQIVLDQTVFFPEGGGQYGDRGTLNEVEVFDTQIKDGMIYHKTEHPIEVGSQVCAMIDWNRRYSMMQNHSVEHIFSGLVHQTYGYDNVGFHLGEEEMTLDFDGMLSKEQLLSLEREVNQKIWENLDVIISYPTKEQLETMAYRSKKEISEQIRIVTIPDVDVCACCAPHVKKTGEIGSAKIITAQKHKSGIRITVVAGKRALFDYEQKHEEVIKVSQLLSVKPEEVANTVKQLQEEKQQLQYELLEYKLMVLKQQVEQVIPQDGILYMELRNASGREKKEACNWLMEREEIAVVIDREDENDVAFQYQIGSKTLDVRTIAKQINETLNGRGGGKAQMVQGTASGTKEQICSIIKEIKRL